jgi:hypothetical protein
MRHVALAALGAALWASFGTGCATFLAFGKAKPVQPAAAEAPRITLAHEGRSPAALELQRILTRSQGGQVLVSRKLLQQILQAEEGHQARCDRLSDQLEGLKNIDGEAPRGEITGF